MEAMKYYVSITGFKVKSLWYHPNYWKQVIPSTMSAKSAPGNVFTATITRRGVQHTLTVWEDRASMLSYLRSSRPSRQEARGWNVTRRICDMNETKVYGYESDSIPTWEEALTKWEEYGTYHGRKPEPRKNAVKKSFFERNQWITSSVGRRHGRCYQRLSSVIKV